VLWDHVAWKMDNVGLFAGAENEYTFSYVRGVTGGCGTNRLL
jgi:hypothetical protein